MITRPLILPLTLVSAGFFYGNYKVMNGLCSILLGIDTLHSSPRQKLKGFLSASTLTVSSATLYYKLYGKSAIEADSNENMKVNGSSSSGSSNDSSKSGGRSFKERLKNLPLVKNARRYVPGRIFILSCAGTAYSSAIANCFTQKYL